MQQLKDAVKPYLHPGGCARQRPMPSSLIMASVMRLSALPPPPPPLVSVVTPAAAPPLSYLHKDKHISSQGPT